MESSNETAEKLKMLRECPQSNPGKCKRGERLGERKFARVAGTSVIVCINCGKTIPEEKVSMVPGVSSQEMSITDIPDVYFILGQV